MEEKKTLDLISIASIPLVITLGNSMLIPVLPVMEKKLDISSFQASLIITVYSLIAIFLIPIAGYLSDRYGRKKVIIPSLIIAAAGGLICGISAIFINNSYYFILIGRLVQGVGAAGTFPVVLPLVGDMYRNEKEVSSNLGLIETANTAGKVLSPIIGASLALITWFVPLLAIPVFCAVSLVLVMLFLKVPKDDKGEAQPIREFLASVKDIFSEKGRWIYTVFAIGGILMYVLFGILFYLSNLLEETHHASTMLTGLILAIPLLALSLSSYITGRKIGENKLKMKWITFIGCLILSLAVFLTSFTQNIYMLIGAILLGGIGIGVSLPCLDTFITAGVEKSERGTVSSFYSSMRFIGVALGPPLFSVIIKSSHQILFLTTAGVAVVACLLTLIFIKPGAQKQTKRMQFE
ncbi:MFS transporter [Virgibacillus halophilus]|uniref:MFS transporter n=1 Tax=Tigheibacillus halophilus TaxID=361280 RepID=UPI0036371C9F